MTITLNNNEIALSDICLTEDGAIFACGSVKDWTYVGRGGEFNDDKYEPCCANCGAWLSE
jgi:hypothetical protein